MKIELERLINVNNVKYKLLVPMINEAYAGSTATDIHIYIDIYSISKILYSSFVDNKDMTIELGEYNSLASCLINMAAHYRNFFRTRYRVESKIYLVYSKNVPYLNNQYVSKYNNGFLYEFNSKKIVTEFIERNMEILRILVPYLPDIFLIESDFETGVIIYDLMCRQDMKNKDGHFIISKDIYNYQLVNMKPQTVFLRTKHNDQSYYIVRNNLLNTYFTDRKVKTNSKIISPDLLTVLMALTSVKERNINTFLNISRAVNILEKAILEHKILNGYNHDLEYLWNNIWEKDFNIAYTTFESRFRAIDIQSQHSIFITTPECANIPNFIINKYDPETVKYINNEYFRKNPLDLNVL